MLLQREQCLETTRKELQELEEKYLRTCSELKEQRYKTELSCQETDSEIRRLVKELREAEDGQQGLLARLNELEQASERKQTEEILMRSERTLRQVIDIIPFPVY